MSGFACALAALALVAGEAGDVPPSGERPPAQAAPPAVERPPPAEPVPTEESGPRAPAEREPAPTPAPAPADAEEGAAPPSPAVAAPPSRPALRAPRSEPAPPARAEPLAPAPAPPPRSARIDPAEERAEVARVARAFLTALAGGDVAALAEASAEPFSFDGEPREGREAIRATWRALLAGRDDTRARAGEIEVLSSAEAIARLGKPPARIAALARPGVFVAIGDVGGRKVVLFLGRERGRLAVLGMHD